ncbi:MAG: glycosyltransferase [Acidobacteriia bacterium]|nr:glycosyltransferase [Terriglobia bacterium]
MEPVIYGDLRCLQDPAYALRGIGHHTAAVLRGRGRSRCASWKLVGLVDDNLDALPAEFAALANDVSPSRNPSIPRSGAIFLDFSPMTHDPRFSLRFAANPDFLKAAVIYDFIPFDWPGYLPHVASRIDYLSKIARLRSFDLYLPISRYSAGRLAAILSISPSRIAVTGASVRSRLYDLAQVRRAAPPPPQNEHPYFFSLGGDDRRKNTETAVAAVRRLNDMHSRLIPLKVGDHGHGYKADLLRIAGHEEGGGFLEFRPGVDDEALVDLMAGATATICPSRIEGFSLPVVEAIACGSPVAASDCEAHSELLGQSGALFPATDSLALADILDSLLQCPERRPQLLREQAPIAEQFREPQVAARFWNAIADAMDARPGGPALRSARKPRLALLAPYPPQESGVALFTQKTVEAAARFFDVDVYTNAPRPLPPGGTFRDAGLIGRAALLKGRYDSIISVIGNSPFHTPIFELFEEYGGPCILHDSRLTHIYHFRLGPERFRDLAVKALGRPVTTDEIEIWLQDRDLPSLFVEPVIRKATPLIVHTRHFQSLLRRRYGVHAELTTFCPNMPFDEQEIGAAGRRAARERLGISPGVFLVSTFGFGEKGKGIDSCVIAAELLRAWNIPVELHIVGNAGRIESELVRLTGLYGVDDIVHWGNTFVSAQTYRDFMLASDAAVQLRSYGFGQASAALADCINAALPCVATSELAEAGDAPEFVRTVPYPISPLLVAEQLAAIWEGPRERTLWYDARRAYLSTHNFDFYIERLRQILELT